MYVDRTLEVQRFWDELGLRVGRFVEGLRHEPWRQKLIVLPTGSKPKTHYPPVFGAYRPGGATDHSLLDRDNPVQEAGNLRMAHDPFMPSRNRTKSSQTMGAKALQRDGFNHQLSPSEGASRDAEHDTPAAQTIAPQS